MLGKKDVYEVFLSYTHLRYIDGQNTKSSIRLEIMALKCCTFDNMQYRKDSEDNTTNTLLSDFTFLGVTKGYTRWKSGQKNKLAIREVCG